MTRIIGGAVGGRRIRTPAGSSTRPTSDRVREALFSTLESELGTFVGLRVLDLYAGSGALGLEARSRGAAAVTLVEHERSVAALIERSARDLGLDEVEVVRAEVGRWVETLAPGPAYDVVLADPPYDLAGADLRGAIGNLAKLGRLAAGAWIVVERARRDPAWQWPPGVDGVRERRYGETMLWYGAAP